MMTCKEGCEKILVRESKICALDLKMKGSGWVLLEAKHGTFLNECQDRLFDLCFAYHILLDPIHITSASVNSFAEEFSHLFIEHLGPRRITDPWAFSFDSSGSEQLLHRAGSVQERWLEKMSKKMSRVMKLAQSGIPYCAGFAEGFFVHFIDFDQAFVSFGAFSQGQKRMQMDLKAPSRSYLKIEEAFHVFGHEPRKNETVVDLGASPGGWSYSALKRGAIVTAVDNGPLKDPVRSHSDMTHLQADALTYKHNFYEPADWLFCDVIETPGIVLGLLRQWLSRKWCRRFIVNLKLGREDPIVFLRVVKDRASGLSPYCSSLLVRQLYHDREEITLMGEVRQRRCHR